MKTVGFFGGSFDPIHFGHIALAIELMEAHKLDEVLFCPAFCSPFKQDRPPKASAEERLHILKLALEIPQFKISTLELDRKGPSYTIDTLRELKQENVHLRLLLSDEAASGFKKWKEPEEIAKIAPLCIGKRKIEISSTEIRERLKNNLYCGHLVPAKALDYIVRNRVYSC